MAKKRTSLTAVADALMAKPEKTSTDTGALRRSSGKRASPMEAPRRTNTVAEATESGETIRTSVYLPLAAYKKLNELAIAESSGLKKKVNDYLLEGVDAVLARRGLPSIAELVKKAKE